MGWELRRGQRYYYRKRRVNGQVVSEYIGTGPNAEAAAAQDALEREQRAIARQQQRAARLEHKEVDQSMAQLERTVRALMHATLLANGFHSHKGQWRKRRGTR